MKKIKWPNWIITIVNFFWCLWSNRRWKNAIKEYPIQDEDTATKEDGKEIDRFYDFLTKEANRVYEKFHYTKDGIDQLGDAVRPPAQCYKDLVDGALKDDCDGFHSALYHIMTQENIPGPMYLASISARDGSKGHAILVGVDPLGGWFAQDYTKTLNITVFNQVNMAKELQLYYSEHGYGENAYIQFYTYDKEKGFRIKV